jgi:DeoR/GlpR family transcriptional regulator of sugar metabolism
MTVSGIDVSAGMTEWNVDDAAVKRAALAVSRRCIVACDSSKFGRVAFARISPLENADLIVTDDELAADLRQAVTVGGASLRIA